MKNLERVFNPDDPYSNQQSYPGFLIGIVAAIDDPQKLGRIKATVPTIDKDVPLPNGNDSWIPCMQRFSGAENPGGSFDPLHVGDQVVLLAQGGDLRSVICIGVMPSTVDPPSPYVDRTAGVFGTHSPGGTISLQDDRQGRKLEVSPTGYREKLDAQGNKTIETAAGAKIVLGATGEIEVENAASFYSLDATGNIRIGNAHSSLGIDATGEVKLSLADSSEVKFSGFGTTVSGQKDEVATLSQKIQDSLAGISGSSQGLSDRLEGIIQGLNFPQQYPTMLQLLKELLETTIPAVGAIAGGRQALEQLQRLSAIAVGEKTVGQIDQYRRSGLADFTQALTSPQEDLSELIAILGKSASNQDWEWLQTVLELSDPAERGEIILSYLFGDRFDSLMGQKLHTAVDFFTKIQRNLDDLNLQEVVKVLDTLENIGSEGSFSAQIEEIGLVVENIPLPQSVVTTIAMIARLRVAIAKLEVYKKLVRERIEQATEAIAKVKQLKDDTSLAQTIGETIQQTAKDALAQIARLDEGATSEAELLLQLVSALLRLEQVDEIAEIGQLQEILQQIPSQISQRLTTLLESEGFFFAEVEKAIAAVLEVAIQTIVIPQAQKFQQLLEGLGAVSPQVKKLERSLSRQTKGGTIEANQDAVTIGGDSGGLKGTMLVDKTQAGLSGPGGNRGVGAQIIAEAETASLLAPGANSSLGSAVRVTNDKITLHGPGGDLGLASFWQLNQKEAFFYAPGGAAGVGSLIGIEQEMISLYAPGGATGIGGKIEVAQEKVTLAAPGAKNSGSKIVADIGSLNLYAAGGENSAGSRITLKPEDVRIKTASLLGSYALFKERSVEIGTPLSLNRLRLDSDRISLNLGLNASLTLSNTAIVLYCSGHFIYIGSAGVLVDGFPLVFGGDFW